jgi:hypothetical protein
MSLGLRYNHSETNPKNINHLLNVKYLFRASYPIRINLTINIITLVFGPMLLNLVEITIIELSFKSLGIFVIEDTFAIELIIFPLSLIC